MSEEHSGETFAEGARFDRALCGLFDGPGHWLDEEAGDTWTVPASGEDFAEVRLIRAEPKAGEAEVETYRLTDHGAERLVSGEPDTGAALDAAQVIEDAGFAEGAAAVRELVSSYRQRGGESVPGRLTVTVDAGNAAMLSAADAAEALREVAKRLEGGEVDGRVRDINGSTVGSFEWVAPELDDEVDA